MTKAEVRQHYNAEIDKIGNILQPLRSFMTDSGYKMVITTQDGAFNFDAYPIKAEEQRTI